MKNDFDDDANDVTHADETKYDDGIDGKIKIYDVLNFDKGMHISLRRDHGCAHFLEVVCS